MSTFLIADDSDGKAALLKAAIHRWNRDAQVLRTRTTEEAKQLIDARKLTWAFIDYEMPTENGPAVVAHLRAIQPDCRVAMVSSSNAEAYRADAAQAGAEAYICSSLESDVVERALFELLSEW